MSGEAGQHDELLTLSEAAAELRVSPEQVRSLCTSGALPFIVVSVVGKRLHRRIRRTTLDRFKRDERVNAVMVEMRRVERARAATQSVEQIW